MQEIETFALVLIAVHVVVGFTATVLVSANRSPSSAIAWVLTIVFIPYLGAIAFLLVGFGRLPARRRAKQREVNELILSRTEGFHQVSHRGQWPEWLPSAVRLNLNLGALPMVGGNSRV